MPFYRRAHVPGGSYFFTVVTDARAPILCEMEAPQILRTALRDCIARWPFTIDAFVLLPDHLHAIWTLPPGDTSYARRWAWIKKEFTKAWLTAGRVPQSVSAAKRRERRIGVWQRRYWEHALRDEVDFERHFDYIHFNPVKHGLAERPGDWPFTSFHRAVRRGDYPADWGSGLAVPLKFDDIDATAFE
jgi:putative transposase